MTRTRRAAVRAITAGGALVAAACFAGALAPAGAQSPVSGISISPVRVDLATGQRSAAITVGNGAAERVVHVEALRWTRVQGADQYAPAPELIVNPPLFRLAPGAAQVVRIGFAAAPAAQPAEHAYRVFFQEVPEMPVATGGTQLQVVLRLGVPVFIAPRAPRQDLRWQAQRTDEGLRLTLDNVGNVHARLAEVAVAPARPGAAAIARAPAPQYVFPGESHTWLFALGQSIHDEAVHVAAQGDAGPIKTRVAVGRP